MHLALYFAYKYHVINSRLLSSPFLQTKVDKIQTLLKYLQPSCYAYWIRIEKRPKLDLWTLPSMRADLSADVVRWVRTEACNRMTFHSCLSMHSCHTFSLKVSTCPRRVRRLCAFCGLWLTICGCGIGCFPFSLKLDGMSGRKNGN